MDDMQPGIYPEFSNEAYHAAPGISKSGLDLIAKCPALYADRYIKGNRPEPTKAMIMGSAIHAMTLEPDKFYDTFAVAPAVDKRTKAGKEKWEEFCAANAGKTILGSDDFDEVSMISMAVQCHPIAGEMVGDKSGVVEESIFQQHDIWNESSADNFLVKIRPDLTLDNYIIDLKTTTSADFDSFMKSCWNFRYHVQAALYLDIANAAYAGSKRFTTFVFIVVEKQAPYQVAVYYADADFTGMGRAQYQRDLDRYALCRKRNEWPGYNGDAIMAISLPPWAASKIAYAQEIYD